MLFFNRITSGANRDWCDFDNGFMGLVTKESVWYSLIKLCIGCALGFVHAKREACACTNYVN